VKPERPFSDEKSGSPASLLEPTKPAMHCSLLVEGVSSRTVNPPILFHPRNWSGPKDD